MSEPNEMIPEETLEKARAKVRETLKTIDYPKPRTELFISDKLALAQLWQNNCAHWLSVAERIQTFQVMPVAEWNKAVNKASASLDKAAEILFELKPDSAPESPAQPVQPPTETPAAPSE